MKKALLLFVLFFSLNIGVYASNEIEPTNDVVQLKSVRADDAPTTERIIYFKDGTVAKRHVDDGKDCKEVYGENDRGLLILVWTNC